MNIGGAANLTTTTGTTLLLGTLGYAGPTIVNGGALDVAGPSTASFAAVTGTATLGGRSGTFASTVDNATCRRISIYRSATTPTMPMLILLLDFVPPGGQSRRGTPARPQGHHHQGALHTDLNTWTQGLSCGKAGRLRSRRPSLRTRRIERHIIPLLGTRRVKDLTKADVNKVLKDIWPTTPEAQSRRST
jgi:hypothetical protein